jgi:hypothetical protein
MTSHDDEPEIGRDTLDPVGAPTLWTQLFPARGSALGLRASSAPALTFILVGIALGPQVLGILNPAAILRLDPVISIALATLGIFVGLGIGTSRVAGHRRVIAAALLEVILTAAVVGGLLYLLFTIWRVPLTFDLVLFAAGLGICSSASAATRIDGDGAAAKVARLVDLDDVPIVVLGAVVVAIAGGRQLAGGMLPMIGASILAGTAGWMLFERARGEAERGAFVAGTVALLAGVAAYTGMSPLLGGIVAALVWSWSPGRADRIIASDLQKLQHPLVALLLIIAGATIQWSVVLIWIAAPLVLLRVVGKLLASLTVAPLAEVPPGLLAAVLLPPGVLGVALALNIQQALRSEDMLLVSAVTVAVAISELVSILPLAGADEETR